MATTFTPQDVLDEELVDAEERARKRPREEAPPDTPELPVEMQLALIEEVERAQRDVRPAPPAKLIEISHAYREAYIAWEKGRGVRMDKPPGIVTLALARLFVSPRFKLLTEMQWPAIRAILEAYVAYSEKQGPMIIFRSDAEAASIGYRKSFWTIGFLGRVLPGTEKAFAFSKGQIESFLHFSSIVFSGKPDQPTAQLVKDYDAFLRGDSSLRAKLDDVIIYGMALNIISEHVYSVGNTTQMILNQMRRLFFANTRAATGEERPTRAMLGWKDKIVVFRAADITFEGDPSKALVRVAVHYTAPDHKTEEAIFIKVNVAGDRTIEDLKVDAVKQAYADFGSNPRAIGFVKSLYHRVEVLWPNDARLTIFDSTRRDPDSFLLDRKAPALAILLDLFEKGGEPVLRPLSLHPEWGYRMSMFLPGVPALMPGMPAFESGLMIMPAPWFFYLSTNPEGMMRIYLARGTFKLNPSRVMLLALESESILAHQPYELIYLPDKLDVPELAALSLLQRRDIPERATSRTTQVMEDEEKIVLL